jgi:hypothetical protein
VLEPIQQHIFSEQREQRHGNGSDLVNRDMRVGGLGPLTEQNRNAVTSADAVFGKAVRGTIRQALQVVERELLSSRIRPLVNQCCAGWVARGPLVAHVYANVIALGYAPLEFLEQLVVSVRFLEYAEFLSTILISRDNSEAQPPLEPSRAN